MAKSEKQIIRDLEKAEAQFQRASERMRAASTARAVAFRKAAADGMSRRGIAAVVGVNFARVQKIISSGDDE